MSNTKRSTRKSAAERGVKADVPETDGPVKTAKAKKEAPKAHPCKCGCGEMLTRPKANFAQGHDARLKGLLQRIARDPAHFSLDEVPADSLPFLAVTGVAGITVVGGKVRLPATMVPKSKVAA